MADISGTQNDDTLFGTSSDDTLSGLGGNDTLFGGFGGDTFYGGPGDDTIEVFDAYADHYFGGAGFDTLNSFKANTFDTFVNLQSGRITREGIRGEVDGVERFIGSNKRDTLVSGDFNFTFEGGSGDDRVIWGGVSGSFFGGDAIGTTVNVDEIRLGVAQSAFANLAVGRATVDGTKLTTVGFEHVTVDASAGAVIVADVTSSTVETGAGDDRIRLGDGDDVVVSGAGSDRVRVEDGDDSVDGGDGDDILTGGSGDKSVNAGAGDDFVRLGAGTHMVFGGVGDDTIRLIPGEGARLPTSTEVFGGDGNDKVLVQRDSATVTMGQGDDLIILLSGETGTDFPAISGFVDGGEGFDEVRARTTDRLTNVRDVEVLRFDDWDTELYADGLVDAEIFLGNGKDSVQASYSNTIYGGGGNDLFDLDETGGQQTFYGGQGNDRIERGVPQRPVKEDLAVYGGDGVDFFDVTGAAGKLYGGAGGDRITVTGQEALDTTIFAGDGNDQIQAYDNVIVRAGPGRDSIALNEDGFRAIASTAYGGEGEDILDLGRFATGYGGEGSDVFDFETNRVTSGREATIGDFDPNEDRLDFGFRNIKSFSEAVEIIQEGTTVKVSFDFFSYTDYVDQVIYFLNTDIASLDDSVFL